jgi:hypothetical protein
VNAALIEDLPIKFRFIWPSSFRGEDFFKIDQSETRIAWQRCLLTNWDKMWNFYRGPSIDFRFIWPSGFRGEDFLTLANQKQELPVAAMFGNGS